jgi:hypothetical protein
MAQAPQCDGQLSFRDWGKLEITNELIPHNFLKLFF